MSASAYIEFIAQLRARGVIPDKAPPEDSADRPWFVALLQGAAGWLAGIFLLSFIGFLFKPESTVSIFAIGGLLLGSAWALYHADRSGVFLDQLALAISIAGQFAVGWGIVKDHMSGLPVSATLLGLQIFVLLVMPNKTARTLAAMFAAIAWVFVVRFLLRPGSGEELFFGEQYGRTPAQFHSWAIPAGWLITWVPMLALAAWLIRNEVQWMSSGLRAYARPLLIGVLLGLATGGIDVLPINVFALGLQHGGMPFSWGALFPFLNVGLAMASAYGAYLVRSNALLGSAVLAALLHLANFYYLYGTTLMWKSAIMALAGAALLLAGIALHKHEAGSAA
ncbi:MAG TPA: DUF4401 domain-containing protein [Steroidobacteraceae bacterium]|jgi:hypothetical protein|nr:DUF4401 domain-containing protein [Steroidobacteraceae bacterium]